MEPVKILVADDHHLLLDGIVSLFCNEQDFIISATASNGFEVIDLLGKNEFDICLLDISMPGMDGIETAKIIKEQYPLLKVIILTTYSEKEIVSEMLQVGVSGYVLKNATKEELLQAIRKVMMGSLYFSEEVYETITHNYIGQLTDKKNKRKEVLLTNRETEILQLLFQEYTNEKIATELNISYRTVETHRKNIMHKAQAHNLVGLMKFAYQNNWIS